MFLRDGTRFRIDNGIVSLVRDRNGNKVTPTQDSLNRSYTKTETITSATETTQYTFKGAGGAGRNLTVLKEWNINYLRADYRPGGARYVAGGDLPGGIGAKTWAWLFPDVYSYSSQTGGAYGGNSSGPFLQGPTSITLPDGRQSKFFYNPYMELARVELPTGGAIEYDWDGFGAVQANGFKNGVVGSGSGPAGIYRRVIERRVYTDGTTLTEKTRYQETQVNGNAVVTVDQLTPSDTLLARSKHYYNSYSLLSIGSQNPHSAISHEDPFNGREYQTESYASDGTILLRKTENTWQARTSYPNQYGSPDSLSVDLRVTATKNTLADSNQVSQQTVTYSADEYSNKTDVYEYDYGSGAAGALVRRSHTDYLTSGYDTVVGGVSNPSPSATIHLRSLPTAQQIFDASGNKKAETLFEYDNYAADTTHAPIMNRSNISGFDAVLGVGYTTRGNVTKVTQNLLNGTGTVTGSVANYSQYDIAGNVVKAIDANGNASTLEYDDRFGSPNGDAQSNVPAGEGTFVTAPSV